MCIQKITLKESHKGFSLIELMVVIIIFVILAVAATSYIKRDSYYQDIQIKEMTSLVKKARITALRNNETVIICSSNDGQNCNTGNTWTGNHIISFTSEDGTSTFDSNTDTLLGDINVPDDYHYTANSSFIDILDNGSGNRVLTFCENNTAYQRMTINSRGHTSLEDSTDNSAC